MRSEIPWEGMHRSGSYASPSPVTDGEVLIASFGSHGIYGLDLSGNVLWKKDLGDLEIKHGHGEGTAPALAGDLVVVAWDHEGPSFLVALDRRTGDERWRVARNQGTSAAMVQSDLYLRGERYLYALSDMEPGTAEPSR